MPDLHDMLLEQAIRRRVGDPGTVTWVDGGSGDLATFRTLAEEVSGTSVELLAVTGGIPGHFSLRGSDRHTVVFHQRQVEICAFLDGIAEDERLDARLRSRVYESTLLRLVAQFLLQSGHVDQAVSALAKSLEVRGGLLMQGPTVVDLAEQPRDERYLVQWFFALGHEIGHQLAPEVAQLLSGLPYFATDPMDELVARLLDVQFEPAAARQLRGIIQSGEDGDGPRSHASRSVLRGEAVADVFAVITLCAAWDVLCAERADRAYSPLALLLESLNAMASVMVVERCRIMASWFSSVAFEYETQALLLSQVALQARQNLLQMVLRDRGICAALRDRFPSVGSFLQFDDAAFGEIMISRQERWQQSAQPFDNAQDFLTSGIRDPALVQAFFARLATDPAARRDVQQFLQTARYLDAPILTAVQDTLDGRPPPRVV